jgi:hypothetical protein
VLFHLLYGEIEEVVPGHVELVNVLWELGFFPISASCHCPQGELRVKQPDGMEFVAKAGDLWTCKKGILEETENFGAGVAIMRIINLLPASRAARGALAP